MRHAVILCLLVSGASCATPAPPSRTFGLGAADAPKVVLLNAGVNNIATRVTSAFIASCEYPVYEYVLQDEDSARSVVAGIQLLGPRVIVAFGSVAARLAREEFPTTPLVYALVAQDESHPMSGEQVMGIGLNLSPSTEFTMYKLALPTMKDVVAFRSETTDETMMTSAREELQQIGLTLSFLAPNALEDPEESTRQVSKADAVWFLNDPGMMSQRVFSQVLKTANAARKPLLSSSFRELAVAGALMAFTLDLENIGGQAASLVSEWLQNATSIHESGIRRPLGGHLVYNEPVARTLGTALPPDAQPFVSEVLGAAE